MNLSPEWVPLLEKAGHNSTHWSSVGDVRASDSAIMEWARTQGYIVFTHDLDYGALLYATGASAPSVIQIRAEDTRPEFIGEIVVSGIAQAERELLNGALVTIDPRKMRITSLPFKQKG